jgi:glutathione S-transferase
VPLSQPVRAVVWPCLIKRVAFTFQTTVPGMAGKIGTKGPDFQAKFPLGTVPALEDDHVTLSESVAILSYLADKFAWHDFYPSDPATRARVHEYMSWSHRNTREASNKVFGPHVRLDKRPTDANWLADGLATVEKAAHTINSYWLQRTPFIAGHAPSIADFACYEELAQLGAPRMQPRRLRRQSGRAHPV